MASRVMPLPSTNSGEEPGQRSRPYRVSELLFGALEIARPLATPKSIAFSLQLPEGDPSVLCQREQVLELFSGLLLEAVRTTPERRKLFLRAERWGEIVRFSLGVARSEPQAREQRGQVTELGRYPRTKLLPTRYPEVRGALDVSTLFTLPLA
jgi:hypothetical protein